MTNPILKFYQFCFTAAFLILILLAGSWAVHKREGGGPWYIGCVDTTTGQQYLLEADQRPVLRDGFIIIGEETFITPRPMMTCRVVDKESLTQSDNSGML